MGFVKRFFHNDAAQEDPEEIYNWRCLVLCITVCFGGMAYGFDVGIIGGVVTMVPFQTAFGIKGNKLEVANLSANIVSVIQVGAFFGAITAYYCADRFGRKRCILVGSFLGIIGAVAQGAATGNIAALYAGRVIAGIGLGQITMLVPIYLAENAPRAVRGGMAAGYQLSINAGIMIAFWIDYGSVLNDGVSNKSWQVPLSVQAIPSTLLFLGMLMLGESPRWLATTGEWETAAETLAKLRKLPASHEYIRYELHEIKEQLEKELIHMGNRGKWGVYIEIFTVPSHRRRLIIGCLIMAIGQMTGLNSINYYAPTIFRGLGMSGNLVSLLATGVYGIVKTISTIIFALFVADSLGRRKSLVWTLAGQAITMLYIAIFVLVAAPTADSGPTPAGYVAIVAIYLFACCYEFGIGPICWIYCSEIYSAHVRSVSMGLCAATLWAFNLVVARATPPMLATLGAGGYGAYFFFFGFCIIGLVFTWFFVPETKGLSLEKMDGLFGLPSPLEDLDKEKQVVVLHQEEIHGVSLAHTATSLR